MITRSRGSFAISLVSVSLVFANVAIAQYNGQYNHGGQQNPNQGHSNFSQGVYEGGRGGGYDHGNNYGRGDDGRYQGHGIGTGKGALIGGAGGAAVGAIFGGGLKGALIGGGAGAGIGAIAGHEHQQNIKHDYYRDGYGH